MQVVEHRLDAHIKPEQIYVVLERAFLFFLWHSGLWCSILA